MAGSDADVSIGADTSLAQAGFAQLRNMATGVGSDIKGAFAGAFAVGGITGVVAAMRGFVEQGHEIHHEAARFNIDAEQLQLIGNAAKQNGLDLNLTARAMNLLTINAQAALNPTSKQAKALNDLGISAKDFAQLNPADQFLTLADAYKNSSQDGEKYADVATLIGKRNTEMIPILALGSAAIREQGEAMGILSDRTVANLEKMHVQIAVAESQLKVLGATATSALGTFDDWLMKIRQHMIDSANPIKAYYDMQHEGLMKIVGVGTTRENPPTNEEMTATGPGKYDEKGTFTPSKDPYQDYYDKLSEVEDKETAAYQATLTKEQLLGQKVRERADLQGQLSNEVENEGEQTDRALELRGQIADLTKEMVPIEKEVTAEAKKKADEDAKWLEDAAKANDTELGNLAIMKLRAKGRDEEADALKTQLDYQEKINDAYENGYTAVAATLEAEKALAAQLAQQEINAKVAAQGMEKTSPLTGFGPYGGGGGGQVTPWMAQGMATDPLTGKVDQDALMRYNAQEQLGGLTGKDTFNFIQRAFASHNIMLAGQRQAQSQQDLINAQKQSGIEFLQGVMSGQIRPGSQQEYMQQFAKAYGGPALSSGYLSQMFGTKLTNIGAPESAKTSVQQQIDLLTAQLDRLTSIDNNLTPIAGY
jgi:hypothetical protein